MVASSLAELSRTSANAMLAAKASKTLGNVSLGQKLEDRQLAILQRAADLLASIVEGSLLIEKREVQGLVGSAKGLDGYDRALSALHALNLMPKNAAFTDLFLGYRERILKLANSQPVAKDDVADLKRFFGRLSEYFFSDLSRPISENRTEPLPSK